MVEATGESIADWIAGLPYGGRSELARYLGVSPQSVKRWARDEIPSEHHWTAIEDFFGKKNGTIERLTRTTRPKSRVVDARRLAALERRAAEHDRMLREIRQEIRALARRLEAL